VSTLTPTKLHKLERALRLQTADVANRQFADMYVQSILDKAQGDDTLFRFMAALERPPIGIAEFLDSPDFMGATDMDIWPEVRRALIEINCNWWRGTTGGAYDEGLLSGATGVGKSAIAMVSIIYHTYLLTCLAKPQAWYGLPSVTSIVFPVMGAKPHVVNKVVYAPLRKMMEVMPYFQTYAPMDKYVESEIYLKEKNIRIVKAGGDEDQILGEAVIGGLVDEINFMAVVQRSKKAEVTSGRAGLYDQAEQVFHRMATRKKGRFQRPGPLIGIVFPSSSTRYKGDFTDKRKAFIEHNHIKTTYVFCHKQYDIVPAERFCGRTFRLLIGNDIQHDTRVLEDNELVPVGAQVEEVPIEYREDFLSKPYDTLRDVLGIAHNAISPFIKSRHKVYESIALGVERGLESILVKDHVILGIDGLPNVKPGVYCTNPSKPRYVHIDLSRTSDECGVSMVRFDGLVEIARKNGEVEWMPTATVEMCATIAPDANNEIDIAEVRAFVKQLKTRYGYPIKAVSYDGFDSRESIQAWRKDGMRASELSMDRTDVPYKQFRDAIYDGRLVLQDDPVITAQFLDLEYDEDKKKVDHPVHGGKDGIDAVCGAYTNLLTKKTTWNGVVLGEGPDNGRLPSGTPRYTGARR
jgi:hypothetical protein